MGIGGGFGYRLGAVAGGYLARVGVGLLAGVVGCFAAAGGSGGRRPSTGAGYRFASGLAGDVGLVVGLVAVGCGVGYGAVGFAASEKRAAVVINVVPRVRVGR